LLSKVEEFKLQEGIRPTGLLLKVEKTGLSIVDFDKNQDKKKNWAAVTCNLQMQVFKVQLAEDQSTVVVWQTEGLVVCKHTDGVLVPLGRVQIADCLSAFMISDCEIELIQIVNANTEQIRQILSSY
jgi:hypothetical protein